MSSACLVEPVVSVVIVRVVVVLVVVVVEVYGGVVALLGIEVQPFLFLAAILLLLPQLPSLLPGETMTFTLGVKLLNELQVHF